MTTQLGTYLRAIQQADARLAGYLLGFKYGLLWADIERQHRSQIAEIDGMLAMLEERNGKESTPEAHARA